MVVSVYQPRVPAGVPTGGQFSTKATAEMSVDLTEPENARPRTVPELALSDMDNNARIEAMRSEIDRALDELSNPEGWARYLEAVSRFHRYSFANTWLIIAQRPDASRVAGFNDWRDKHRRRVRKGEKAIWVQAPMTKKVVAVDADSGAEREVSRVYGFRPVPVFDVSQTDGEPLPQAPLIDGDPDDDGPAPEGMVESLSGLIEADGFTIRRGETGEAGGWTDFANHEVVISQAATPRQAARTLAHEAAHIALGHGARASEYHTGAGGKTAGLRSGGRLCRLRSRSALRYARRPGQLPLHRLVGPRRQGQGESHRPGRSRPGRARSSTGSKRPGRRRHDHRLPGRGDRPGHRRTGAVRGG